MENIINNEVVRFTSELCRGGDISDLLGMRSDHGHPQPRHRRPPPVRNDSGKVGLLFGDVHPGQPPLPDRADNRSRKHRLHWSQPTTSKADS